MSVQNEFGACARKSSLTTTEQRIADLWREIITPPAAIDPTDNFFALGGDSLAMTMVLFRIKEELGIDLPPGILVEVPELRPFCARLDLFLDHAHSSNVV